MPETVQGLATNLGPVRIDASRMAVAHSLIWSTSELHTLAGTDGAGRQRPPLATGPWVAAVVAGLYWRSSGVDALRSAGIELDKLLEMDITYHGPVHGDDLVEAACAVLSCDESAAHRRIVIEDACRDTTGRPTMTITRTYRWTPTTGDPA